MSKWTSSLVAHHKKFGRLILTAVQPPGRYGVLEFGHQSLFFGTENLRVMVAGSTEGFVLEPDVINHIEGDTTIWARPGILRLMDSLLLITIMVFGSRWILCEIVFLLKTFG